MNEVEIVDCLERIQSGGLNDDELDALYLSLKHTAAIYLRNPYAQTPLCLAWYTTLMLEDGATAGHRFLTVKDPLYRKKSNRQEATFAIALAYNDLKELSPQDRKNEYGFSTVNACLRERYTITDYVIRKSKNKYLDLVQALKEKQFSPETINTGFARFAMEQVYEYAGVEPNDVFFEAVLEDQTLIQYFRDGHFRVITPPVESSSDPDTRYATFLDRDPPRFLDTHITRIDR